MDGRLVVVTSGFPRVSETFALNELLALEERGVLAGIFATKPGDHAVAQPGARRLARHVSLLPPGSAADQASGLAKVINGNGGQIAGIHGYFAHRPAEVAMETASLMGIPFGFSVHARDARKVGAAELGRRARRAACVIACNPDVAGDLHRAGSRPLLVPHGVDLRRFRPARHRTASKGTALLVVGRLVEKKGFDVLLRALASTTAPVRLTIVGDGPQRRRLEALVDELQLGGRVRLAGATTHAELPTFYASADVVVVPSIVDTGGDRDGLPNVILEAMASGLPVVASSVGAITSAVVDGLTGLITAPGDERALARSIDSLAGAPDLRRRLGVAARKRAEDHFDLTRCTARLYRALVSAYA
jgi:glycosyltransferase involved in cell wall biosynthesis